MSAALAAGFAARLIASTGAGTFYNDLGGRIYNGVIPDNVTTLPHCRWVVITDPPRNSLALTHIDAEIQLDVWGQKKAGSAALSAIADRAYTLLHRQALTVTGFAGGQTICIDRGGIQLDEGEFRITQRYRVVANS